VTTIQKVKDLTKLPMKKLIDSLMTHEIIMDERQQKVNPKKILSFKIVHHINDGGDNDKEIERAIALTTRQFRVNVICYVTIKLAICNIIIFIYIYILLINA